MAHEVGGRGWRGTWRSTGAVRRQSGRRELWTRTFAVVSAGRNRQGRVSRLASGRYDFSGLRATRAVPRLVSGSGVIRAGGQWSAG